MAYRILARYLLICIMLPLAAAALNPRPLCPTCRRYADQSPQSCTAQLLLGGKHPKQVQACSLFCLIEALEQYKSKPEVITIVSYPTLDDDFVMQINVLQAYFLYGAEGSEKDCHEPYIYAFPTEKAAKEAQDELKGELLEWDAVKERCEKLAADWEPDSDEDEPSEIPHRKH